jgi:asparagine N-glycosylation enzyme membrane subunit Stt3
MYVHLGGSPVAPFGVFLAALLTRDWKGLLKVGGICAVLAAPYLIHFFNYLDWYNGRRGHVAGDMATLSYLLAVPGLILLLRRPRENLFLLVWAVAPLAWFFQDRLRFFLQSSVVAAAIGAIFLAWLLQRLAGRKIHTAAVTIIVLVALVFPLSIPSLPIELAWAAGLGFPRELDWDEARTLAAVMEDADLGDRITL